MTPSVYVGASQEIDVGYPPARLSRVGTRPWFSLKSSSHILGSPISFWFPSHTYSYRSSVEMFLRVRVSLASLDRLLCHVEQSVLGLALGEVGNRGHGLLRIVLRECPRLLNAVALQNQLASLKWKPCQPSWSQSRKPNTIHKLTLATSPSCSNFLPTSSPSSGFCFHANSSGAVASPSSRSAPAGFPRLDPVCV